MLLLVNYILGVLFSILDLLEVLFDTIRIDQAFLKILATVIHRESLCHVLLNLNHIVENFDSEIFVLLEIHHGVLSAADIPRISTAIHTCIIIEAQSALGDQPGC